MASPSQTLARDPGLGRPLGWSAVAHVLTVVTLVAVGYIHLKTDQLGRPDAGGTGSVAVDAVDKIPIPRHEAPENRLAADTESDTPTQRVEEKKQEKDDPDAIALLDKKARRKQQRDVQENRNAVKTPLPPNTIPTTVQQAASSDLYGKVGPGGVGVSDNAILGNRFGAYAELLRQRVARAWHREGLAGRTVPQATVSFELQKNGTVQNVKITKSSGLYLLDQSAQRAILEAAPFPGFPPGLNDPSIHVEFIFELKP